MQKTSNFLFFKLLSNPVGTSTVPIMIGFWWQSLPPVMSKPFFFGKGDIVVG